MTCGRALGDRRPTCGAWSEWVAWSPRTARLVVRRRGLDRLEGVERDGVGAHATRASTPRPSGLDRAAGHPRRVPRHVRRRARGRTGPPRQGRRRRPRRRALRGGRARRRPGRHRRCGRRAAAPAAEVDPLLGDAERVAAGLSGSDGTRRGGPPPVPGRRRDHPARPRHGAPRGPAGGGGQPAVTLARGTRRAHRRRSLDDRRFPRPRPWPRRSSPSRPPSTGAATSGRPCGPAATSAASARRRRLRARPGAAAARCPCRRRVHRVRRRPVVAPVAAD